jgi:hypothetical protein
MTNNPAAGIVIVKVLPLVTLNAAVDSLFQHTSGPPPAELDW